MSGIDSWVWYKKNWMDSRVELESEQQVTHLSWTRSVFQTDDFLIYQNPRLDVNSYVCHMRILRISLQASFEIDLICVSVFVANHILSLFKGVFSLLLSGADRAPAFGESGPSGGARDSMLPGHSQVNYLANQVKRKSRDTIFATVTWCVIQEVIVLMYVYGLLTRWRP